MRKEYDFTNSIITSPNNKLKFSIIWNGKDRCKKTYTKRVIQLETDGGEAERKRAFKL